MCYNANISNSFIYFEDEYGHWNGIIGVLQRHEADLSVSALTITYNRVSVVGENKYFQKIILS